MAAACLLVASCAGATGGPSTTRRVEPSGPTWAAAPWQETATAETRVRWVTRRAADLAATATDAVLDEQSARQTAALAHLAAAREWEGAGYPQEALAEVDRALTLWPDHPQAHVLRVQLTGGSGAAVGATIPDGGLAGAGGSAAAVGLMDAPPGERLVPASVDDPALEALVAAQLAGVPGRFGVAVKNLDTGQAALLYAERELPAASLFKLPVMYEVFRQAREGRLRLTDQLILTPYYAQYDLGTLAVPVGSSVSIAWALEQMITRSDNATANLLLGHVGAHSVNATMRALGLDHTRIALEDLTTSAGDMLALLERLARDADAADSSADMLRLLLDQRVNDRLPAQLPPGARVAHKTGNLADVVHDVGIVYGPHATYAVALLAADVSNVGQVTHLQATSSRSIYDYFQADDAALGASAWDPSGAAGSRPRGAAPAATATATSTPSPTPTELPGRFTMARVP